MKKELPFSYEEILKEISSTQSAIQGFTIGELADFCGHSRNWCREKIKQLIKDGKVQNNGTRVMKRMDGKDAHIPVYVLVEEKKR